MDGVALHARSTRRPPVTFQFQAFTLKATEVEELNENVRD